MAVRGTGSNSQRTRDHAYGDLVSNADDVREYLTTRRSRITPERAGLLRDRLKQLGVLARLDINRSQETQGGSGRSPDVKVQQNDTQVLVAICRGIVHAEAAAREVVPGLISVHVDPTDLYFTLDPSRFAADSEEFPVYGLRRMTLAPFVDYYWGSKYNALDQFVRKGLSFLPAGALVALSARTIFQPGAARAAIGIALASSAVMQVGRYFLSSYLPSVTDVLIACAAAWLAFRFTQYLRSILWAETVFTTLRASPMPLLHFITPWRNAGPARQSDV